MMEAAQALAAWTLPPDLHATPDPGLINHTWLVGRPVVGVLQWVNPIFAPEVNLDIALLTERLAAQGLGTPRLLPTREGQLWLPDPEGGCWRVLSYVPGRTLHAVDRPAIARAAGELTGRFHRALDGWQPQRHAPVRRIHDTAARMAELRAALEACGGHPLEGPARELGQAILGDWEAWEGPTGLPERQCHGDLKISNFRFDLSADRGVALIDLDTVGPMELASELGDAWRSWCNPAGEGDPDAARFELPLFEASLGGWWAEGPPLGAEEAASLVPGIERICLELSARFCADAVANAYFREDRTRFPEPGSHNLLKARSQHALARSARGERHACEGLVSDLATRTPRR